MAQEVVKFSSGLLANYQALTPKDAGTIYFTTDTHQIFVGDAEYTKGTEVLASQPTDATVGETGKLYAYNGALYLCQGKDAENKYTYIRVANVNDTAGTVTSVAIGEGLTNPEGSDNPIVAAGTIQHAVAAGAAVVADDIADVTPDFGESFNVVGVATDKFGHVVGVAKHSVTLPEETPVTVETATGEAAQLVAGGTFTVVTEVEEGVADQSVKRTATTFTLPADKDTTYTIEAGSEDGKIKVTPSDGSAYEVLVKGWENLAKKSEIASVFKYKGSVATVDALPKTGEVGDVYHVVTTSTGSSAEFVCKEASAEGVDAVWEELGEVLDLSEYAKTAEVIQRVAGATGEVAKFNEDGTLSSTGFTLGVSVPADAKFTDTTYGEATQDAAGLMSAADKTKLDGIDEGAQVNKLEGVQVGGVDLSIDDAKKVNITLANFGVTVSADDLNSVNDKLPLSGGTITGDLTVNGTITGNVTGALTGNADTATKATQDANGNVITDTYATKEDLANATIKWSTF